MLQIRKSQQRGHVQNDWLNTYHTFSFGTYYDAEYMGFRSLRVINEDRVQAKRGFAMHSHNNMEIITYVLSGELEHKDSMGNGSVIRAGDVQYMSAGTGVQHSEFNPSTQQIVHLLQIWILPNQKNATPRYDQRTFNDTETLNRWCLLVSEDGAQNSIAIRQQVKLYASKLSAQQTLNYELAKDRYAWLQVVTGEVSLNGQDLHSGDGVAISEENLLQLHGLSENSTILLFDLN